MVNELSYKKEGLVIPRHVAIIMDGNGRWAKDRGMKRTDGHRAGVKVIEKIVKRAKESGVDFLTLYAFSTENWSRPKEEVDFLMSMLKRYIRNELDSMTRQNIKINIIGDRSYFDDEMQALFDRVEVRSKDNNGLNLMVALNYGSKQEILNAVKLTVEDIDNGLINVEDINEKYFESKLYTSGTPDVDLMIRTSGEKRLSNFLLWQCAYAEFIFFDKLWPDFSEVDIDDAIIKFSQRNRRFGNI